LGWPRQKLYDMTFLAGIEAEVTMLVVVLLVDDNDDDGIAAATENNGSLPIARYEKRPNNDRISIDVTECRILRYPIALGRQKEYSSNTRIRYRKSSSYPKLSKSWRCDRGFPSRRQFSQNNILHFLNMMSVFGAERA
jgi:hypothetical protein